MKRSPPDALKAAGAWRMSLHVKSACVLATAVALAGMLPTAAADEAFARVALSSVESIGQALEDVKCDVSGAGVLAQGTVTVTPHVEQPGAYTLALTYPPGTVTFTCQTPAGTEQAHSLSTGSLGFSQDVSAPTNLERVSVPWPDEGNSETGTPPTDVGHAVELNWDCAVSGPPPADDYGVALICAYSFAVVVNVGCAGWWYWTYCVVAGAAGGGGVGVAVGGTAHVTSQKFDATEEQADCSFARGDSCGEVFSDYSVERAQKGELCSSMTGHSFVRGNVSGLNVLSASAQQAYVTDCAS